jgi:predicted nucleic acid-binding protein
MKVFFDTNVILDMLLYRGPFYADSRAVYDLVEFHELSGCVSSSAITDIFYIAHRELKDTGKVYAMIDTLAADFTIVLVLESTIKGALSLRWKDFEDVRLRRVQFTAARENGAAVIISRNMTGYETAAIPCMSPAAFIASIQHA